MKIIVGLGNPGPEYRNTRHNVGFMVIEHLMRMLGTKKEQHKHKAILVRGQVEGEELILVRPLTFMNLSGQAVSPILRASGKGPADLLVIYDDMDLPVGKVRIRAKGSSGGHKGMKSIIECLGTSEFARIRIGVGRPEEDDVIDHVLGRFSPEERVKVEECVDTAARAALLWATQGIEKAMNTYN